MKILFIDNYDSFTYNLVHYFEGFDVDIDVFRNDIIPFDKIDEYNGIVLSPGPGLPTESGQLNLLIDKWVEKKPILGICLGFQAIIEYYRGTLSNQSEVKHGVSIAANFDTASALFQNLPEKFDIGLYHSWKANRKNFPIELEITGTSEEGVIMAFQHRKSPVYGVQFHPESILTEHGHKIVENFICTLT